MLTYALNLLKLDDECKQRARARCNEPTLRVLNEFFALCENTSNVRSIVQLIEAFNLYLISQGGVTRPYDVMDAHCTTEFTNLLVDILGNAFGGEVFDTSVITFLSCAGCTCSDAPHGYSVDKGVTWLAVKPHIHENVRRFYAVAFGANGLHLFSSEVKEDKVVCKNPGPDTVVMEVTQSVLTGAPPHLLAVDMGTWMHDRDAEDGLVTVTIESPNPSDPHAQYEPIAVTFAVSPRGGHYYGVSFDRASGYATYGNDEITVSFPAANLREAVQMLRRSSASGHRVLGHDLPNGWFLQYILCSLARPVPGPVTTLAPASPAAAPGGPTAPLAAAGGPPAAAIQEVAGDAAAGRAALPAARPKEKKEGGSKRRRTSSSNRSVSSPARLPAARLPARLPAARLTAQLRGSRNPVLSADLDAHGGADGDDGGSGADNGGGGDDGSNHNDGHGGAGGSTGGGGAGGSTGGGGAGDDNDDAISPPYSQTV
jgi:hypothetical protein